MCEDTGLCVVATVARRSGNYSDISGHNVSPCPEKSLSSGFEANRRCFRLGRQPEAIALASYKPT